MHSISGSSILLVSPSLKYQTSYLEYIEELKDEERYPFSLDFPHHDFPALLQRLENFKLGIDVPRGYVQSFTYWMIKDRRIIGVSNFRPDLTPELARCGGHIGMGVRPSERGNGLGNLLLKLTLEKAKEYGLRELHIHCYQNNVASNKAIQHCGGQLIDSLEIDGAPINRYKSVLIK